jgi:asparagine synthase (glutamine-hydrolysing)
LAIIDLDPSANQPFLSADGRYALTFNGEIYNYRQLRADLERQGVRFRTESDTEVLLESFRAWGESCVERLSGMFAFAIWDNDQRRLFCARDRAGEKPFYWALLGDSFIFASELKALLEWPGFERHLDPIALVDFLTFGFVPEPRTIWRAAHKLPPGQCMSVQSEPSAGPRVNGPRVYWDWRPTPDQGQRDWSEIIRDTLQKAAREMAVADVPLGTFLSGGVDSSSVTAALSRAGLDVAAFTIGFEDQAYDERAWAQRVASRYGVNWSSRVVDAEDVEPVWERLIHHYDEPFNDYSYFPTYYVCREARKQITVALSGDGSDEMFAGYSKYQRLARMGAYGSRPAGSRVSVGSERAPSRASVLARSSPNAPDACAIQRRAQRHAGRYAGVGDRARAAGPGLTRRIGERLS